MSRAPLIRPEARAALWRWREVLAGLALIGLGLWWVLGPGGLLGWIGWALGLIGAALATAGIQRGRFRGAGGGPGVVQVVEGQISYFGPLTGGHAAMTEISRLRIDHDARPSHWLIDQPGQPVLAIPVDARGADALFDAFGQLPGLTSAALLEARRADAGGQRIVWQTRARAATTPRLH